MTDETQTAAVDPAEQPAVAQGEPAAAPAPDAAPADPAAVDPAAEAPEALRTDGPTLKEWVEAGYAEEAYPPTGYEAVPERIHNLNAYRGIQAGPAPHPRAIV